MSVSAKAHRILPRRPLLLAGAPLLAGLALAGAPAVAQASGSSCTFGSDGSYCVTDYTGEAYNAYVEAELLGLPILGPDTINEVGPIDTPNATNDTSTILHESFAPLLLTGAQLSSSVVTGSGISMASESLNSISLDPLRLGVISTGEVQASSMTSACNPLTGTATSTASSTIASLTVLGIKIKIPNNLKPNTGISLGALGSVTLNQQYPITDGLADNAIDINLITNLGLGSVQIILGHAESDESC